MPWKEFVVYKKMVSVIKVKQMTEQISNNKKIIIVKVTKPDYLSGLTGAI
ncbi:MAG: hypothetical protein WA220_11705 [Candidatus Nitrosopolaris sp.]